MSDTSPLTKIRRLVRLAFPWLSLTGVRTYRVTKVNTDGTIDCDPSPVGFLSPPKLRRLPATSQWLAGAEIAPNVGDELLIVYRDHDPARPAIVGFSPLRTVAPISMAVGGLGGPPAARKTDVAVWLLFDPAVGLYYSTTSVLGPWSPVATNPGTPTPPPPGTPGTPIPIATGSTRVTIS